MAKKDKDKLESFWYEIDWGEEDDKSPKRKTPAEKIRDKRLEGKKESDTHKGKKADDSSEEPWWRGDDGSSKKDEEKKRRSIWDDDDDDDFDLEWLKKYTQSDQDDGGTAKKEGQQEGQQQSTAGSPPQAGDPAPAPWPTGLVGMNAPISTSGMSRRKIWFYLTFTFGILVMFGGMGITAWMYYKLDNNKHCYGSNIILAKMYTGDPILINVQDVKRGSHILRQGYIDSQISTIMYRFVRANDTVIDIGSGFGYYTMYLARIVGPRGHVYSFEARKETYDLLVSSLRINSLYNVHAYHQLLFSSEADVLLDTKDRDNVSNFGTAKIIMDYSQAPADAETRRMKAQPLDAIMPDIGHVSLMHINARGNELSIITGARHLIARSPGIKIIMSWDKAALQEHTNVAQIVNQFFQLGFHFWLINNDDGELIELFKAEDVISLENGRLLIAKSLL